MFRFLSLFAILFISIFDAKASEEPLATKGILDLRNQKFEEILKLNGEWNFYWNELIEPGREAQTKPVFINFPSRWDNFQKDGKELPSFGYASYSVIVLLPKNRDQLQIGMPDVYSSYRLYINGELAAVNGKVGKTVEESQPYWEYQSVDIPIGVDTLEVILQISNFVHSKGGIKKDIQIGERKTLELMRKRLVAIDLTLTGCLVMAGLFFLGLYLMGNRDHAVLAFALFSLVYSYRTLGIDNYVLHSLFPHMNWWITVRLEYSSLFFGIGFFSLYSWLLYPRDVNWKLICLMLVLCSSFGLASLILSPPIFTQLINPFLIVMVFCLVYIPYLYLKAYRNKRPGSFFALASSGVLMIVFLISLLHYWSVIPGLRTVTFICYLIILFLQSLVLSHRVSFTLKKSRKAAEQGFRAKSEFLSTMSHEIRTPLNSVIGMSHLLLKEEPRKDQVEKLEVMLFSANNLLSIVNDILDYTKIEAGKITFENIEIDIHLIVRNIILSMDSYAREKQIDLTYTIDNALSQRLIGDPTRLTQVLSNLVHNAIKFTHEGYVSLSVGVKSQNEIEAELEFRISDTGIGISQEKQQLIFERFTQADSSTSRGFGGTGLGLSISKRILELQNSKLELESKEGIGSTFYFTQTFPKSSHRIVQVTENIQLPSEDQKPLEGVHILLVEDNPMNVMVAQKFLERWGAVIDVATNGQEALDLVDKSRHNLVLIDLQMPIMDGFEASRRMRAMNIQIPIIALTANLPTEVEKDIRKAKIDDVVVKPFLPDELYRTLLKHL